MGDKEFKYVPFVTEVMTARNPKLSEPDTAGEYADGKYKTEATADPAYTETLQQAILAVAGAYFGSENVHLPWKETKEGSIAFNFKSPTKKPELTDAKGNPIKAGVIIGSRSLIRLTGVIAAWEKGSKRGVSLWPDAVRVIKLVNASQSFGGPEDGYDGSDPAI
jgi:DNA-directed RNA polymerase